MALYDRGMMLGVTTVEERLDALVRTSVTARAGASSMCALGRDAAGEGIAALALEAVGDPFGSDDVSAVIVLCAWLTYALDECELAGGGTALDVLDRVQARLGSMS